MFAHSYRNIRSQTQTTNGVYGEYYRDRKTEKIKIPLILHPILHHVDAKLEEFKANLAEILAIKSISSRIQYRNESIKAIKFTEEWLKKLDMDYECFNVGKYEIDGVEVNIPPVILAMLGKDSKKKTICVYCFLDIQEVDVEKWKTDPFKLTEIDNTLYGVGIASGKGPMMYWFHVLETFQSLNMKIPVNVGFIIESTHHMNSLELEDFLTSRRDFFGNVDCVVMSDSQWIGEQLPCIIYGAVGMLHFNVTIEKCEESTSEIKDDMENLFKEISDENRNILIPNFTDHVQQITPDEEKIFEKISDFNVAEFKALMPPEMQDWDQMKLLMHFWRYPSIYVNDIEECICKEKDLSKILRRFIIKIVPNQMVQEIENLTKNHIKRKVKDLKIQNKVECELVHSTRPWLVDINADSLKAARRACIQIFKSEPDYIREDTGRVILNILDKVFEKQILFLPIGSKASCIGEENENLPMRNFVEGTKNIAMFLWEFARSGRAS